MDIKWTKLTTQDRFKLINLVFKDLDLNSYIELVYMPSNNLEATENGDNEDGNTHIILKLCNRSVGTTISNRAFNHDATAHIKHLLMTLAHDLGKQIVGIK